MCAADGAFFPTAAQNGASPLNLPLYATKDLPAYMLNFIHFISS